MLYRVKLNSVVVDARNRDQACALALSRLRETPDAFIGGVYVDETNPASKGNLAWRLVTGK